jgi:hypothetical protein
MRFRTQICPFWATITWFQAMVWDSESTLTGKRYKICTIHTISQRALHCKAFWWASLKRGYLKKVLLQRTGQEWSLWQFGPVNVACHCLAALGIGHCMICRAFQENSRWCCFEMLVIIIFSFYCIPLNWFSTALFQLISKFSENVELWTLKCGKIMDIIPSLCVVRVRQHWRTLYQLARRRLVIEHLLMVYIMIFTGHFLVNLRLCCDFMWKQVNASHTNLCYLTSHITIRTCHI